MRIAITGATGTLGAALVRRLLADDDRTEIMGVARRLPAGTTATSAGQGRLRWTTADLGDAACLPRLDAAFCEVDAVVHLAWGHRLSERTAYLERLAVAGTGLVMTAATRQRVPHVVQLSSAGVYSPKVDDRPVDESYPTDGISGSTYSRLKVAAERLLDAYETGEHPTREGGGRVPGVTRMRPGLVGHHRAPGSTATLHRFRTPPTPVPDHPVVGLPLLPLDRLLVLPVVHADDVADAVVRALTRRVLGPFNLAAPLPATPPVIASVLGARTVHVPAGVVRAAAIATGWGRRHSVEAGWLDLAMRVPLLDTRRAATELGWSPDHDAESVLTALIASLRPAPPSPGVPPPARARRDGVPQRRDNRAGDR